MSEVLIAGIGSPFGADRLGWAVIETLQAQMLPVPARLLACRLPSELCTLLLDTPRAIVIDAMLGEGPPGTIHLLGPAQLPQAGLQLSSHASGLLEAVQLALALGMPASRLQVLALDVVCANSAFDPAWVDALVWRVKALLDDA